MLIALILICTGDLSACTKANAVHVMRVPDASTVCGIAGQAMLASTSIGRDLAAGERVKIVCERRKS